MNGLPARAWQERFVFRSITLLLVLSPLAFASVHVWSSSLLQAGAFIIFLVWSSQAGRDGALELRGRGVILLGSLFALVVVVQLLPLPERVVSAISPGREAVFGGPDGAAAGRWTTISIHPQATLQELLNFLACLSVFIVVANTWTTREQIVRLVRVIVVMGSVLVLLAILQKATWNGRLYWFYPISEALQARSSHIWGPYVNRNHFAGYLEMAMPLSLGYLLYTAVRTRPLGGAALADQVLSLANSRRLSRLVALGLAVSLMSGALLATLSRGAVLGFVASLTLFTLLARSRRSLRRRALLVLLLGAAIVLTGLIAAWDRLEERFLDLGNEDRIMRTQVWSDLGRMVREFPVLGTGYGTFDRAYPRYQTRYSLVLFEHAENDYLELLTDTGGLGASVAIACAILFFVDAARTWSRRRSSFATALGLGGLSSCTAIAVHSLTDFNLRVPANAFLLAVIAALTVASLSEGNGAYGDDSPADGQHPLPRARP